MGLLKHLLFWPVTGPMALVDFSLRRVEGVVHHELTDDQRVKEDLMELQMKLELGEVDEAEYARAEAEIVERLKEVRAWRRKLGVDEEWAPLEFPKDASSDTDDPEPWSQDSSSGSTPGSSSS